MTTTTPSTLRAFHGDAAIKTALLKRLHDDADEDRIVKGQYWERGKGCAVGCTIRGSDHSLYETELGIPVALAYLEDAIFEGLPNENAMRWPIAFIEAIPVGADLSRVSWAFLHRILTDQTITPGITHPLVRDAVSNVADIMKRLADGHEVPESTIQSAQSAAWSAAWSAQSAESAVQNAAQSAVTDEGAAYVAMSRVLLELLVAAPVPCEDAS